MAGNFHYFTQAANVERFETAFKLPLAGRREGNSISTSNGYYWSSSQNGSSNNYRARYLRLSSSRVDADSYGNRTYGNSVRCFKDSANAPETLTLTFNENKGSLR